MPTDLLILGATALLALVALVAAVITVRTARAMALGTVATEQTSPQPGDAEDRSIDPVSDPGRELMPLSTPPPASADEARTIERVRMVEGRIIVMPTAEQVAATALSRPATRLTVLTRGLTHALRPQSRDRIRGLMRREFRRRRRERTRAARHAARAHVPSPGAASWIGTVTPNEQHRRSGS